MKLLELLEFDPRVARATQQAAAGIGQAGQSLKGPLTVSDLQGRVEQGIDKLEKEIAKDPDKKFGDTFKDFLVQEKEAVKVTDNLGFRYDNGRLIRNGKPNSAYIRSVLKQLYKELNRYIQKKQKQSGKDYFSKQKPTKGFRPQI